MNLAGQGIAIGNNFCGFISAEMISNDESEMEITKDSNQTSLTNDTVGTQPFVINPLCITNVIINDCRRNLNQT